MALRLSSILLSVSLLALTAACSATEDGAASGDEADITAAPCKAGGQYCGGDKVKGDPSTLYLCDPFDGRPKEIEKCGAGCGINASTDDACKIEPKLTKLAATIDAFYTQLPNEGSIAGAVTPELLQHLKKKEKLANGDDIHGIGIADFICAQDTGMFTAVHHVTADGDLATMTVSQFDPDRGVSVTARLTDSKITGWRCAGAKHTLAEAKDLVTKVYGQHGPEGSSSETPPPALAKVIDFELQRFLEHNDTRADGMTCAQDIPNSIKVGEPMALGETAVMKLTLDFGIESHVWVTVDLDQLKISSVACDD